MLSWMHRVREHLGLTKTWMRKGYQASLIKGNFKEGQEKAAWRGTVVANMSPARDCMQLVADDKVIEAAFSNDFKNAKQKFEVADLRRWWSQHLESKRSR
eukprot:TRINITY_DN30444_c0_g1_i1.p2 TRINITY_DN30444_c0_g1~~TRINITY_DN30444_c0_g1_i1.p2  ORF type:complete len:100 (+),score=26.98 TRINITY_DN30444_c0_g1_i1:232-531(+)